jgi:hypothetical protein
MDELWFRLDLTDDQLEVLVHMVLRPDASSEDLVRDVWPHLNEAAGLAQLDHAAAVINAAASAATGKPGAIVTHRDGMPGDAFGLQRPEVYVEVLGEPWVEVH